ncbi:MAG: transcription termination factor NusA [Spirochaetales bacterium]|nr:transcription termination factor NusA [Spirochaetales bacterium]
MVNLTEAINEMIAEKNISKEMVQETVREFVKAAYKRKFGTDENVIVNFIEEDGQINMEVSASRVVVEEENYYNEVTEIPLDEAKEMSEDAEVGDELVISLDPQTFDRSAVQSAKQRAQQSFKDIQNNYTYKEFKNKEGKVIQCYVNSITPSGDLILNVGNNTEGILPKKNISPLESYSVGEGLKCYLERVENAEKAEDLQKQGGFRGRKPKKDVRIILSRTSPELVRNFIEAQVPEIDNGQIEIVNIVREAGFRTKIAVRTFSDIDPIGATVGLRGIRIQTIMQEIDGEKIDVIKWEDNPLQLISNALTPAKVNKVLVLNAEARQAVAIVDENQVGLAIGQRGVNVKLAKKLCDWVIEVKTQAEYDQMEISQEIRNQAEAIFEQGGEGLIDNEVAAEDKVYTKEELGIGEDENLLSDLPLSKELVTKLNRMDVYTAEEYFNMSDEEREGLGLTEEEINEINSCVAVEEEYDDSFECPTCHQILPAGTLKCPHCMTEFVFE